MILDAVLKEGDPLRSVRSIEAEYRINPLTALKGHRQIVAEELVEMNRERGMFINAGARDRLLRGVPEGRLVEDPRDDSAAAPEREGSAQRSASGSTPVSHHHEDR